MKVHGYEVPQSIQDAIVARMKREPFRASDLEGAVQWDKQAVGMRVVDRIIQRERQAGNIEHIRPAPMWKWVTK